MRPLETTTVYVLIKSHRGPGNKKEQRRFWREFDIAPFQREIVGYIRSIVITGFEIKGFAQPDLEPLPKDLAKR